MTNYSALSDDHLFALLRDEESYDAFTEIYRRYQGPLYLFAFKRLGNRDEAKDLLHDLFLTLWNNRTSLPESIPLAPYLYRSVKNRIANLIARQHVSDRYLDSLQQFIDEGVQPADHLARHNQLSALIEKEITALPPKMREVFEMSRKENYTRREIADVLTLSEQTVKSHVHSALRILRLKLGSFF